MLYISESHGVGSTPLRVFETPEVAKVRFTIGITATCWISRSLAWVASVLRLFWSVSFLRFAMIASKSLLQKRA